MDDGDDVLTNEAAGAIKKTPYRVESTSEPAERSLVHAPSYVLQGQSFERLRQRLSSLTCRADKISPFPSVICMLLCLPLGASSSIALSLFVLYSTPLR